MATGEDLMHILAIIRESNELSRAQMKDIVEAIAKKGNNENKWSAIERYKHITSFTGKPEAWEEWQSKIKGVIKGADSKVMEVITYAEMKCSETTLKSMECYDELVDGSMREDWTADEVEKISYKLHDILINQTTGEAHAVVRRCTGENGLLAWKRLCTSLNPRTLASGVKAINQVNGYCDRAVGR
jgi:hypothetical protein